jgi:RNA polymerase primary sigma factor
LNATSFYIDNQCNHELLSKEDEFELLKKAIKGDKTAEDELVERNQRLVLHNAQMYHRYTSRRVDLLDLVQAGNYGLLKAIRRFDISGGTRLSTYAVHWIRNAIRRHIIENAYAMRPVYRVGDMMFAMSRRRSMLEQQLGREVTCSEVVNAASETSSAKISESEYSKLSMLSRSVSLDATLNDDSDMELSEVIPDTEYDVEELLETSETRRRIWKALGELDPRVSQIIVWHFGLDGNGAKSYQEIARLRKYTKARAQQYGEYALRKLRETKEMQKWGKEMLRDLQLDEGAEVERDHCVWCGTMLKNDGQFCEKCSHLPIQALLFDRQHIQSDDDYPCGNCGNPKYHKSAKISDEEN